jgi:hypothetical protein
MASWPGAAFAQHLGHAQDADIAPWRVAIALIVCLALALAGAFALRWRLRAGPAMFATPVERQLRLVETLRLSHQIDICLLECDGRRVLVATTAQGALVIPEGAFFPQHAKTD